MFRAITVCIAIQQLIHCNRMRRVPEKKVKKKFHALRYGYSWEVPLIEHIFRKSGREISFKIYVKMLAHFWWLEYLDMQKYQMSLIAVSAGTCNSNKKSCLMQQTESAETWKPIHSPFLLSFSFVVRILFYFYVRFSHLSEAQQNAIN